MAVYTPALSDEIYLMILQELQETSPKSTFNACLASSRLCSLATSCMYRSVQIPFHKFRRSIEELSKDGYTFERNVLTHSRRLIVLDSLDWDILAFASPRMRNLHELHWRHRLLPFPRVLKEVLKSLPHIKLHVGKLDVGCRDDEEIQEEDRNRLQHLIGIPNIRSVKAEIVYEEPVAMRWLKDVLLSSENLEVLHLELPRDFDGSAEWENDCLGIFDLCVQPEEQLQSLQELVYESRIYYDDEPCLIPAYFFNWTKIRRLTLRGPRMILMVMQLTTYDMTLTSLTLEHFCEGQDFEIGGVAISDFISSIHGLESLTLVNPVKQLPVSTLAIHGETLKELHVHHPRRADGVTSVFHKPKPYLPSDLNDLQLACPHLETLSLDVFFASLPPYDILDALAHFSNLSTLRIFISYETDGRRRHRQQGGGGGGGGEEDDSPHPTYQTDIQTVRDMYSHLLSRRRRCQLSVPLKSFEVMLGDFPGLGIGRAVRSPQYMVSMP